MPRAIPQTHSSFYSHRILLLLTITILARNDRTANGVFLTTNKTFEGICLALAGKFLQKKLRILRAFKTIL